MMNIVNNSKPVIAKVHGAAFAAGCQLVATCDLALSTNDAIFATPGVNIGLFCSTPMVAVSRNVSRKKTIKMLLTGESITAQYAKEIGLINDYFNNSKLEEAISIKDLANLISNEIGYNGKPVFIPERPQEVKVATCSADKSRKLLNYSTKTTLKESIKHTADYIRKMGTKPFKYYLPVEIVNDKTPEAWTKKLI